MHAFIHDEACKETWLMMASSCLFWCSTTWHKTHMFVFCRWSWDSEKYLFFARQTACLSVSVALWAQPSETHSLNQSDNVVKMTICTHWDFVRQRQSEGKWEVLNAVLFPLASCRRPCRFRLLQCPQGPASPLGWWASPKPGRCNCAGVSHSSQLRSVWAVL